MKLALCDGELTVSGQTLNCDNWVVTESSVIVTVDSTASIDAAIMAEAFGAGFLIIGVPLMTLIGIRFVFQTLKIK